MKLLNLGCGGNRPQGEEWWNLDELRTFLKEGTPERTNLDKEPRYVEHHIGSEELPFPKEMFDGILCQHVLEHMDCHTAVETIKDCHRRLKPCGVLVVSVPDVDYFMQVHDEDNRENAINLFGEPISEPWHESFFSYALFHRDHIQILNYNGLLALLVAGGFKKKLIADAIMKDWKTDEIRAIDKELTRWKFSAIAYAFKEHY